MGEILFHLMRSCSLYSVGIGMLLCPDNCANKIGLAPSANIPDDDDVDNSKDLTTKNKLTCGTNTVSEAFLYSQGANHY